jgi:hypothetical protein
MDASGSVAMHVEIPHFLPGFGHHPPATPKPHHPLWIAAGLGVGVLLVGILGGALLFGKSTSDHLPHASSTGHTVRYEVDGSSARVSYAGRTVGSLQLPWSHEVATLSSPGAVSLVAHDRGSGYVACRIYVDGMLRASQESSGADAVATCAVSARR